MTKAEIVEAIKRAWTRELLDEADLREDIADTYAEWVRGIVQAAAPDLQGQPAASNGGGQEQGGSRSSRLRARRRKEECNDFLRRREGAV